MAFARYATPVLSESEFLPDEPRAGHDETRHSERKTDTPPVESGRTETVHYYPVKSLNLRIFTYRRVLTDFMTRRMYLPHLFLK